MTDYSSAGEHRREYNADYYRANKHIWANVNKERPSPQYLALPTQATDDQRVRKYSEWFSGPQDTPPPVFFSAAHVQDMAALQRAKIERVAESSEFRNALYLNNLKYYMARDEEMPGDEKKWFKRV